jgi:hypothetical protein
MRYEEQSPAASMAQRDSTPTAAASLVMPISFTSGSN